MPYTYMLRCSDGSYYVGSTWQLEHRVEQHQLGHGAEYTKRRRPVELVYAAEFERIDEAFAWEKRVQNWGRAKREALIRGDFDALPGLSSRRAGSRGTSTRMTASDPLGLGWSRGSLRSHLDQRTRGRRGA